MNEYSVYVGPVGSEPGDGVMTVFDIVKGRHDSDAQLEAAILLRAVGKDLDHTHRVVILRVGFESLGALRNDLTIGKIVNLPGYQAYEVHGQAEDILDGQIVRRPARYLVSARHAEHAVSVVKDASRDFEANWVQAADPGDVARENLLPMQAKKM